MRVAVLLTAAGTGLRLGHDLPKALVPLAGHPILSRALAGLREAEALVGGFDSVITTAPLGFVDHFQYVAAPFGAAVVTGGETRQESVAAGLAALSDHVTHVLVHDAARPLAPPAVFQRVVDALRAGKGAVVPGLRVSDTVKRVGADGSVKETLERDELQSIQTPQGFQRALLARAHAAGDSALTDDAGLVEAIGEDVHVVPGDPAAFKITLPFDLALADALMRCGR